MSAEPLYRVEVRKGWSYVIGPHGADPNPWRYQWEAQEEADRLNAEQAQRGRT